MSRYEVTVTPREGIRAGNHVTFTVNASDPQPQYGTSAQEIADNVARDCCDSGSVIVSQIGGSERAVIGRS